MPDEGMLTKKFIIIDDRDNVATSVVPIARGELLRLGSGDPADVLAVNGDIPFGHKFALVAIPAGGPVIKYGEVIGTASKAIAAGDWVHIHNLEGARGRGDRS